MSLQWRHYIGKSCHFYYEGWKRTYCKIFHQKSFKIITVFSARSRQVTLFESHWHLEQKRRKSFLKSFACSKWIFPHTVERTLGNHLSLKSKSAIFIDLKDKSLPWPNVSNFRGLVHISVSLARSHCYLKTLLWSCVCHDYMPRHMEYKPRVLTARPLCPYLLKQLPPKIDWIQYIFLTDGGGCDFCPFSLLFAAPYLI